MKPLGKNELLLKALLQYYHNNPGHTLQLFCIIRYKSSVSLRILDWLVTNYSKNRNICYNVKGKEFNMYLAYKSCLKAFSKKAFDPFARRDRIALNIHPIHPDEALHTTVAQLNFFRWCFANDVLKYAIRNEERVNCDMVHAIQHRYIRDKGGRKRRELSKNNTVTNIRVGVVTPLV
tara:strand:+ start:126 stop:656 length:531 start_codon:yes stop_codon:yes gene_type:complete